MAETDHHSEKPPPRRSQPGWDALVEDVFELNIRGVHTLAGMVRNPRPVYAAARSHDWKGHYYTPSVRLFISLLAILLLLRVFWIGEDGHIVGQIKRGLARAPDAYGTPAIQEVYIDSFLISLPITMFLCALISSLLVRVWGKDVHISTQVRLYFLVILPGFSFSILSAVGLEGVPAALYLPLSIGSYMMVFLIDSLTAWRGGVVSQSPRGRVGKSLVLAAANGTSGLTAIILSSLYSNFMIRIEVARIAATVSLS